PWPMDMSTMSSSAVIARSMPFNICPPQVLCSAVPGDPGYRGGAPRTGGRRVLRENVQVWAGSRFGEADMATPKRLSGINYRWSRPGLSEKSAACCVASVHLVESDGNQNQRTDRDLQIKRVDRQQVPAVVQHTDDQCAAGGADRAAARPGQAGAADDAGRDRLQLESGAGCRDTGAEAGGQQHAADG